MAGAAAAPVSGSAGPLAAAAGLFRLVAVWLTAAVRLIGPPAAFVAGLALIPLKTSELFAERVWIFDARNLAQTLEQIDGAGWVSFAVIVAEGLVAGAIFMFAVSYSLTFNQNIERIGDDVTNQIGKVGDDIINHISTPVNPPADSITVKPVAKRWIDELLDRAERQAAADNSSLAKRASDAERDLEAARIELASERAAAAELAAQISLLNASLSKISEESTQHRSLIEQLKPLIHEMKELGEKAEVRLVEQPLAQQDAEQPGAVG